jgi:opacity protein-like surface antigen
MDLLRGSIISLIHKIDPKNWTIEQEKIMKIAPMAVPIFISLSTCAHAGSPGTQLTEPAVANFRTVILELWEEPSSYYIGILGSRQYTQVPGQLLSFSSQNTLPLSVPFSGGGADLVPGFVLGARRSAHGFVLGAEFTYNRAPDPTSVEAIYRSGGGPVLGPPNETVLTQRAHIGSDAGLRLVLGRDLGGMQIYGALGVATASVTTSMASNALNTNGDPIGEFPSHTRNMTGTHMALGAEFRTTQSMSVRIEYSRTNYGSFAYNLDSNDAGFVTTHRINALARRLTMGAIFEF